MSKNIDDDMNEFMKEIRIQQSISDALKSLAKQGATEEQAREFIQQKIVSSYPKKKEQKKYLEFLREALAWKGNLFKASAISE